MASLWQINPYVAFLTYFSVGDTGFEPVTSSVSGKRATTAPIARRDYLATESRGLSGCPANTPHPRFVCLSRFRLEFGVTQRCVNADVAQW